MKTSIRRKILHRLLSLSGLLILGMPVPSSAQGLPELSPVQTIIDRQAERAQAEAAERAERQAESVQERALERVEAQAQGAQEQAAERIQEQVERVQSQAAERAGEQVEQVQSQAAERAQEQVERVQRQAERLGERVPAITRAASERVESAIANGVENRAGGVLAQPDAPALPERLPIPDSAGNPAFVEITLEPNVRAIEYEWIMLLNAEQRRQLNDEAPDLLQFLADTQDFSATGGELLTFRVPPDLDAGDAILELVPEDLRHLIDRNHVYSVQTTEESTAAAQALLALPMPAVCEDRLNIGIIDSAVEAAHPAFSGMAARGARLQRRDFLDSELAQPVGHGTAVAGLLAGEGGELRPLLPGATLYSAAVVYAQDEHHQGTTVLHLLRALDWLIAQDIDVINMSLAGPDNRLLAQGIAAAAARGKVIVAAAGNAGPHAPPQYPAAYEEVVAVTAVARDAGIYRWAIQGEHIDYAALGVSVPTARAGGGFGPESGTSLAAPVLSAFLACALADGDSLGTALSRLQSQVKDLGEPGHDPVYGHGLLHP